MMKTIIAGSRDITKTMTVEEAIVVVKQAIKLSETDISETVSGGAKGVDAIGEIIASEQDIPLIMFPADWNKYGKSAGPIRNKDMAKYADALIAVWDGQSKGTRSMISCAVKEGLEVYTHIYWK